MMKPITEIILAQLCKLLPNRVMTSYMKSIMSINHFSSEYTGNAQAIVKECLYPAPIEFSVDRAGLWLFNREENGLSLFNFIHETIGIIVKNKAAKYSSLVDIRYLLSTLELHSILLMPLRTQDNNREFIFLGKSTQVTHWSDAAVLDCQLLSPLFHHTLITTDISNLQKKLQHQNQPMLKMEKTAKISNWDYEISILKLTWIEDAYRIYGLSHSDAISTEKRIKFYSPDTQKILNMALNSAINNIFLDVIRNFIDKVPIANTIIQLEKYLNLNIYSEGFEFIEQLEYLKKCECNVIQGYYFFKPINPKEWLNNWVLFSHIKSLF